MVSCDEISSRLTNHQALKRY
jgi:hypothetical protein